MATSQEVNGLIDDIEALTATEVDEHASDAEMLSNSLFTLMDELNEVLDSIATVDWVCQRNEVFGEVFTGYPDGVEVARMVEQARTDAYDAEELYKALKDRQEELELESDEQFDE